MNRNLIKFITGAFIVLLFTYCSEKKVENVRSFCYWNTSFEQDTDLYKSTRANHMYIRYFDVDWDPLTKMPRPIASISSNDSIPFNFTPSVYFCNTVFEKSSKTELDSLAKRVYRRINSITESFGSNAYYKREIKENSVQMLNMIRNEYNIRVKDILIDCDWSEGTKDNYFYFIKQLKRELKGKQLEVTLRLWQYRDRKLAGVPPVDCCLLMCYNMERANDYSVVNSIASMNVLNNYISDKPYPLKLNIALPIFSWAVLFRNNHSVGLIGNVDKNSYEDNPLEYKNLGNEKYLLLEDKVIGSFFARRGDLIRVERVSPELLMQMAKYLKKNIHTNKQTRITLFSWNRSYIQNLNTNEIDKIFAVFDK